MAITFSLTGCLVAVAHEEGGETWLLVGIGFLSLFAMSQLSLALVNWMTHLLVKPHSLPRIRFSQRDTFNVSHSRRGSNHAYPGIKR